MSILVFVGVVCGEPPHADSHLENWTGIVMSSLGIDLCRGWTVVDMSSLGSGPCGNVVDPDKLMKVTWSVSVVEGR